MIVFVNGNPGKKGSRGRSSNAAATIDLLGTRMRGRAAAVLVRVGGGKAELATMRGHDSRRGRRFFKSSNEFVTLEH